MAKNQDLDLSKLHPFCSLFAPSASPVPVSVSPYTLLPIDDKETDKDPRKRMSSGQAGGFSRGRGAVTFSSQNGALEMGEVCRTEVASLAKVVSVHIPYQKLLTLFTEAPPKLAADPDDDVFRFAIYNQKNDHHLVIKENEYLGSAVWNLRNILALRDGQSVEARTMSCDLSMVPHHKLKGSISIRFVEVCLPCSYYYLFLYIDLTKKKNIFPSRCLFAPPCCFRRPTSLQYLGTVGWNTPHSSSPPVAIKIWFVMRASSSRHLLLPFPTPRLAPPCLRVRPCETNSNNNWKN